MTDSEFDIIDRYFSFAEQRSDVELSGGDDCAILTPPSDRRLLITTDTLISGVHFPQDTSPEDIAYKSVMVNLSDLAAMGADPAWLSLAITIPDIDHDWLSAFSGQLSAVLAEHGISLIGGDTTRGQLSITVQAMGFADKEMIMRRDRAMPGEKIYVTGNLGDAAIGLKVLASGHSDEHLVPCIERLNRPQARVAFARELAGCSRCAIDVSDGLLADLGHVLKASHCGASLSQQAIPMSEAACYYFEHHYKNTIDWSMVLTGGDDYELCFTVPESNVAKLEALAERHRLKVSCIGTIVEDGGLTIADEDGVEFDNLHAGFDHFQ